MLKINIYPLPLVKYVKVYQKISIIFCSDLQVAITRTTERRIIPTIPIGAELFTFVSAQSWGRFHKPSCTLHQNFTQVKSFSKVGCRGRA